MTTFIGIHGHAYQPPREDPATGEVAEQISAAPYHDWNERITDECYRPMSTAKVVDADGQVADEINLWGEVSFDLGPTLGVWLDRHAPDVADAIESGDGGGLGAMAHPWVHAILPLTPAHDRVTIIKWGVCDYRRRFGVSPRSMWLPETAVDTASLEAFVDEGIEWTMLAPHQVDIEQLAQPCFVALPSGRSIIVVPYDGKLSHAVAFGGMLEDGVRFGELVAEGARSAGSDDEPTLTVVSTDVETFGHHHRFGEMALARAVQVWRADDDIELITPQRFLDHFGPTRVGSLVERTSWSCAHGVERWRSNCGCRFNTVEGEDQAWRGPLRDVLDALCDAAGRLMDDHARQDLRSPWAARNDYGHVLAAPVDHQSAARSEFLESHLVEGAEEARGLMWMEAERLRLEAWSSCAWFFDSPDRIETVQVLAQAQAAADMLSELTGTSIGSWFTKQVRSAELVDQEEVPA